MDADIDVQCTRSRECLLAVQLWIICQAHSSLVQAGVSMGLVIN